MTADQLTLIQNPIKVNALSRELDDLKHKLSVLAMARHTLGKIAPDASDLKEIDELGKSLMQKGFRKHDMLEQELGKPALAKRIGTRVVTRGDDRVQFATWAVFPANVPDSLIRELWLFWSGEKHTAAFGLAMERPHIYRHPRHVMISQYISINNPDKVVVDEEE